MEFSQFYKDFARKSNLIGIKLNENKANRFYTYMQILLKWNEKMNLTAIIEPQEVLDKHFIDSITIDKYIKDNQKIIDVGTGAGFPGIPISIMRENCEITLLDSLNKRIQFLKEVEKEICLKNVESIHGRAEDFAIKNREKYDIAVSRAVANLPVLLEYLLPFVKLEGYCICMKASQTENEIKIAQKSLEVLGGKIEKVEEFVLPETQINRTIIVIKKERKTPEKYPRKAGIPSKNPII